jgi:hypothetical protein
VNLLVDSSVFIAAAQYRPYRALLNAAARRGQLLAQAARCVALVRELEDFGAAHLEALNWAEGEGAYFFSQS